MPKSRKATLLYWMVVEWEDDFSGCVLDYGAYPDPRRAYFTLKDAKRTLAVAHPGTGQEGAIYAGLERLPAAGLPVGAEMEMRARALRCRSGR